MLRRKSKANMIEAAIQVQTTATTEIRVRFANTSNTPDGGTHLTGLRAALTRTINDWAKRQTCSKMPDANFTGEDTREGLTAIISVKLPDPAVRVRRPKGFKLLQQRDQESSRIGPCPRR